MAKKFSMTIGALGAEQVIVDGEDITEKIIGGTLSFKRDHPTYLVMELSTAEGQVDGEAQVGRAKAAADLIAGLDPEKVEAEALEGMGWGDGGNLTAAILSLVVEKLRAS